MIVLALSQTLDVADPVVEGLPTIRPQPRPLLPAISDPAGRQRKKREERESTVSPAPGTITLPLFLS
jgi:hypothetical protein